MRKVLVLEDEENIRSFVVINLKRAGYQTIEAATACLMTAENLVRASILKGTKSNTKTRHT